eukprot:TRINITY_DN5200_c0_g2_i1.p2 TRINITY_DN5200_c0_g2~~TRINITY_DN5200_c0_g2_i1.p2  ORF type:complete len:133 (-),score=13.46 TRINITY_DN5200_c0_g2_i1:76-474(-)
MPSTHATTITLTNTVNFTGSKNSPPPAAHAETSWKPFSAAAVSLSSRRRRCCFFLVVVDMLSSRAPRRPRGRLGEPRLASPAGLTPQTSMRHRRPGVQPHNINARVKVHTRDSRNLRGREQDWRQEEERGTR